MKVQHLGAVDPYACRNKQYHDTRWTCGCAPKCLICGEPMHSAVHGPRLHQPAGSEPVGHAFEYTAIAARLEALQDCARAAIAAGDWKVDGACDPEPYLGVTDSGAAKP